MSVHALTWAWDQRISPTAKLVLIALADGIERDSLASITGLDGLTVIGALSELGKHQLVIWRSGRPFFRINGAFIDVGDRTIDEG